MLDLRGLGRSVISAVVLSAPLLLAPADVAADNFGSNTAVPGSPAHACDDTMASQCIANNGTHWWFPTNLQGNQLVASRYASDSVFDPVADVDTVERSDNVNVDLLVYDSTYVSGFWAWTRCQTGATPQGTDPNKWCRPQELRYNNGTHPSRYDTLTERRYLACHEMGHSLGLRHSGNTASCMFPDTAVSIGLASHDTGELNAQYTVGGGEFAGGQP